MKNNSINLLGEVIKREREMLAMSIDDLSSVTEISSTYIERIEEKHILKPYPEFIYVLSDALGVDLQIYLQHDLLDKESEVQIGQEPHIDSEEAIANASLEIFRNLTSKKERVEDTHSRHTFLIRIDLLDRLDKHAQERWGFMKEFINFAIESALDEIERYSQEEIR